ncbi:MAG: hypothetical protein JOZ15_22035 [Acidobacteria bacterium]|nr:hypothetical protein [Acidobacteriota bacterium]
MACTLAGLAITAGISAGAASAAASVQAPAPPPPAPAVDYAVVLARPVAAGLKRLAVGSLSSDDHLSGIKDGAPSDQRQVSTIRYVVATEIQEVSPKGNAVRATLTVRRLVKESGGVSLELAKPGAVITARLAGRERVFELAGARLAPDLQQALAAAVPLHADDEPTDDDLFGTVQRRRVGESWKANGEIFARFGAGSMTFDPKDVAGTVTLAGVKPVNGQPCLDVRWKLDARHGSFKAGSLPPGFAVTTSSVSVTGSALVPVDTALPPAARETSIAAVADISGEGEGGAPVSLHHELRQVVRVELSKIP